MLLKAHSAFVIGVNAQMIDIEVDLTSAERQYYHVVGLPDAAIKESGRRVQAAIRNCGFGFPRTGSITVNLAPADFKKEGSCYDLPIALALLGLTGALQPGQLSGWIVMGELSLDGRVRPIRGALPVALSAQSHGFRKLLVPAANARESAIVEGIDVHAAHTLPQVLSLLRNQNQATPVRHLDHSELVAEAVSQIPDFADVKGQASAKRAVEVACAGGHNLLLIGPPGAGKTMLARRIPSIIPEMTFVEALETTAVHSVCGKLPADRPFVTHRPFRAPHHTISAPGLVGGSSNPRPGEVSLAHNGVLFLDELPEFHRPVLEVLRQPLEEGHITISRAARSLTFPANFVLVAAMNPCPCGYFNSVLKDCVCSPGQIHRYLSRISGPLLDRIDLHVDVPEVRYEELISEPKGEPSRIISNRVSRARSKQVNRFADDGIHSNSQMQPKHLRAYCKLKAPAKQQLEKALRRLGLSARAYDRILKVSRTIADLEDESEIQAEHVAEAIQYRSLDRNFWEGF